MKKSGELLIQQKKNWKSTSCDSRYKNSIVSIESLGRTSWSGLQKNDSLRIRTLRNLNVKMFTFSRVCVSYFVVNLINEYKIVR